MDDQQRKTLQSLLRMSARRHPRDQPLEELELSAKTHLGLYRQEGDAEGAAIYALLLEIIQRAKSWEEVERLAHE